MEELQAKLASQEAELIVKNQNIEALITKIGLQTEKVRNKREAADVEAQKVRFSLYSDEIDSFLFSRIKLIMAVFFFFVSFFLQVALIQAEVSVNQKDCENDLAKAEPLLIGATAALDTLNKVLSHT